MAAPGTSSASSSAASTPARPRGASPAHRLDGIPPTIFTQMSALAMRTGAVNLGQGFPDVDGPASSRARVARAVEEGANQ